MTGEPLPDPARPASYPRRALVCLVGLSPQVVTETLYALATDPQAPWWPTELHLVTTADGARQTRERLLGPGHLQALVRAHGGGAGLDFDPERHLHVVQREGQAVADLTGVADHAALADTLLGLVRRLAQDPACAIHASLAGGRKSMGFYLGYVLSLLGRPQDRLSHVLVEPPAFERRPDFFFPPPEPVWLDGPGGPLCTADARVVLAPVAFVRMSEGLPEQLRREDLGFAQLVQQAQLALSPMRLTLRAARREVQVEGFPPVVLEPALFAWYLYFCLRRQRGLREDPSLLAPGMLRVHRHASRTVGLDPGLMALVCRRVGIEPQPTALTPAELRTRVSPINKALLQGFGTELGSRLTVSGPADRGTRDGQYGLVGLDAGQILVV
jgi:CRISPR-associated protein (TIGR02584 family)